MGRAATPDILVLAGGGVAHTSGGVGTLMLYLMDEWARRGGGPSVHVIDTRGQGGVVGGLARFFRAIISVLWRSTTGHVDVVHAHMTTRGSAFRKCILCALAHSLGLPTVIHMHGADFIEFYGRLPPSARSLLARTLTRAQSVIVLGEAWAAFLTNTIGVPRERIEIVMNGVRAPDEQASAAPRAAPHILFLGRMGDRKGVPELIEALASPAMAARAWVATIAGDGEVERFRASVDAAGLGARVTVPGWVGRAETARLLASADIFVLPSHHEAMPIAIIEALAHRVAVLATPVGVIPEVLRHDEHAWLTPPGDPALLAQALAALVDDPALRARLAQAGYAVFRERLDIAAVADHVLGLYRAALISPRGQTAAAPGPAAAA